MASVSFANQSLHMTAPQSQNGLSCGPCNKTFTTRKALLRHQRENKNHQRDRSDQYCCLPCDKTFARNSDLLRHHREQHEDGKIACENCHKPVRPNAPHKSCIRPKRTHDAIEPSGSVAGSNVASTSSSGLSSRGSTLVLNSEHDSASSTDISEPLSLPFRIGQPLCPSEVSSLCRAIPCGLCRKQFSAKHPEKLVAHLNRHFEELQKSKHKCDVCKVAFRHDADLQKHLASAEQGDCGFMFVHKTKCSGHHPPLSSKRERTVDKKPRLGLDDDDRFEFCFRVRNWEHAQQTAFMDTIKQIEESKGAKRQAQTASCGRTLASSSRRTDMSAPGKIERRTTSPTRATSFRTEYPEARQLLEEQAYGDGIVERPDSAERETQLGTELLRAAASGNTWLTNAYLSMGVSVNFRDPLGLTALHCGVQSGLASILDLLLEHGAKLNTLDSFGMSPVSHACIFGFPHLVEWFVSKGAQLNVRAVETAMEDEEICAAIARGLDSVDSESLDTSCRLVTITETVTDIVTHNLEEIRHLVHKSISRNKLGVVRWFCSRRSLRDLGQETMFKAIKNGLNEPSSGVLISYLNKDPEIVKDLIDQAILSCRVRLDELEHTDFEADALPILSVEKSLQFILAFSDQGLVRNLGDDQCPYAALALLRRRNELAKRLVSNGIGASQLLRVAIRLGDLKMVEFTLSNMTISDAIFKHYWRDVKMIACCKFEKRHSSQHCRSGNRPGHFGHLCELCRFENVAKDRWEMALRIEGLLLEHGVERGPQSLQEEFQDECEYYSIDNDCRWSLKTIRVQTRMDRESPKF